ncbi:unnamed protein product [Didymodactylos carnosus]|uniref:Reverse transcriptase domain-containing protein n=1 Tax=Didymodactylos carnosus TaxID=1234261 RepID=A0A814P9Q7_9BILA|nr:unnamed protein product [Didymodactylos carnosus]CAF3866675.1 unnamed protein product [Didymodactylos carnosus]
MKNVVVILQLAEIVLKETAVVDGNKLYKQIVGEAMDSPFTLTLANIFMWKWEKNAICGELGSNEIMAAGGLPTVTWLHDIFVDVWKNKEMVEDWTLIRLYKNKGDKKIRDNYRGISFLAGVKFAEQIAYRKSDFFHTAREKLNILALMYADDLVAMCNSAGDLEKFITTVEKSDTRIKTCIMMLKQPKEDSARRIVRNEKKDLPDIDIVIRNQKVDIVDFFAYPGCFVSRDRPSETETETRRNIAKASTAFNMLRNAIWYQKTISIEAKLRICELRRIC